MASRILTNSGLEIEQTLSTGYLALVVRGIGLVRDTGVQNITGQKYFYDVATLYSGVNIVGKTVVSGNIAGDLSPETDNTYDLGSNTGEWRNLFVDGIGRIDNLHVDENASITGNLSVLGTANITGAVTLLGDFVPTNVAANFLPKTDNLYDLGSSTQEFKNLWIDGIGRIDSLHVDENASVSGSLTVSSSLSVSSNLTVSGNSSTIGSSTASSYMSTGSGSFGQLFITGTGVPASQNAAGTRGQLAYGSGYFYVCTGTNSWGRTHLTGWV